MKSLGAVSYDGLKAVLSEHGWRLSLKASGIYRNGGFDVDVLELSLSPPDEQGEPSVLSIRPPESVVRASDRDEAQVVCAGYDALKWFGDDVVIAAWRGSMSPDDYFPEEAPNGPFLSYSHYRLAMIDSGECRRAQELLNAFDDSLFETVERAARRDAGLLVLLGVEPTQTETRAEVVGNFAPRDPDNYIDHAVFERPDDEERCNESHHVDNGLLCCPFCREARPRDELALYVLPVREGSKRDRFLWGCRRCFSLHKPEITLDRLPTVEAAMKWTNHLLSKTYYQHPRAVASWLACLRGIFGDDVDLQGRF